MQKAAAAAGGRRVLEEMGAEDGLTYCYVSAYVSK